MPDTAVLQDILISTGAEDLSHATILEESESGENFQIIFFAYPPLAFHRSDENGAGGDVADQTDRSGSGSVGAKGAGYGTHQVGNRSGVAGE